jgi:hypothetical protein
MAGSLELELSCVRISGGEVDLDFRLLACFAHTGSDDKRCSSSSSSSSSGDQQL